MEKISLPVGIDALDLQILRMLQKDATHTHKEIAAQLGLTITPVYERVRRLERDGFIQKYVALLSPAKAGLGLIAFCNVSLVQHSTPLLKLFEETVLSLQEVVTCYHIAGQFDYMLKIIVPDMEAYQRFIVDKLAALDNIRQVQSSFVMTEVKYSTELPLG
ncbi:MAG: Lrp/AsnC family transcriptional regulator [Saprospirales bacterium]|jgi:Lrp/AsnC family leucine-responsive transcriptional regulator|nr:Lrp/AsnC family transcriptional regulator [Saprospirales bacterium]MBK6905378.1 Lrp/AsnC family transcriptional regulator [Saprospirales bacterium]